MATIEIVKANDDLDPRIENGVETVVFFDPQTGRKIEIELGEANRKHLANHLEKLTKYVDAGRVVETETKPTRKPAAKNDENTKIREWARANGFEVGDRGRIKAEIVEAYRKAQEVVFPDAEVVSDLRVVETPEGDTEVATEADILKAMAELEAERQGEIDFKDLAAKVDARTES